ncbi:MAG: hypothetical protein J6D54_01635 [Olsenella sp.]|nr:hypothetical protein [Olsenella sp.]
MDITPYLGVIATVGLALVTFYGAVSTRLARLETKLDDLVDDVQKHNGVVERTAILERDQKATWKQIDSMRREIHELER